jgi:hypothetical protein
MIFRQAAVAFNRSAAPFGLALRESLAWGAPTTRLWLIGRVSNANFRWNNLKIQRRMAENQPKYGR